MALSLFIRGWLLLVPLIPSIIVSIFNLYHFLTSRELCTALNNHVLILLLLCGLIEEVTDISWLIHFFLTGTVVSSTPAFCLTWAFIGPSSYISNFILMAWASIERHILIFYPNWFATKRKRLFFHYLPLATCILWPMIFYSVTLLILPCNAPMQYIGKYCGRYTCLRNISWATWIDTIANYIIPAVTTVIFSVVLFVRVLYSRYRIRGRIDWKNYKILALQLLPISTLYLVLQFPEMILYAAYTGGLSRSIAADYYPDSVCFTYWVILFTPFAISMSLPNLKRKCRNAILFWRRNPAVGPEVLMNNPRNVDQTPAVVWTTW